MLKRVSNFIHSDVFPCEQIWNKEETFPFLAASSISDADLHFRLQSTEGRPSKIIFYFSPPAATHFLVN